jgi:2Fe-2S ferredoxin
MYSIQFKFEQKGLEPVTLNNISGDQNLVEVALDNKIELHHNCGMVCGCSTCHIYLESGDDNVPEISDREEDFIDRARNPRINSRLACQCILEAGGEGTVVLTVPDQSLLHGE